MTRKASDSPMRVTARYLVSLGSSNSSGSYRSVIQTAPMCVYLWPYMGAKLELHIPSVLTLVTLAIYPQVRLHYEMEQTRTMYICTTGTLRKLLTVRNCMRACVHVLHVVGVCSSGIYSIYSRGQ